MGSAASAPSRRRLQALKGRRYMRGMNPEKYFEVVVKKEHREMFDILGFSDEEAFEIFVQFMSIDDDNSGEISVDEFHYHLDSQPTKFSERVFAILDRDMSGLLDVREFIVGIWNYCTYDTRLVSKLLFDVFDVDRSGRITVPELDAMLRMLYGLPKADGDLLNVLAINGREDHDALTFEEFLQVIEENAYIVQPAFELQKAIRRKILGVKYWEKKASERQKMFVAYDQDDLTSAQAVDAIISAKQKDRAREREARKAELAAKHDDDLWHAADERRAVHENHQFRKMQKLEELRNGRPADEVEEESAWEALRDAQAVMSTDFIEDRVDDLRAARESLWQCYDRAVAASEASTKLKAERELELALKDDAISKADAWIRTKQGSIRYDFSCRQVYGNLLHRDYLRRGPPMSSFAALHAPGDSSVTLATKNPRPIMMKEAKAIARERVISRFAQQEAAHAAARAARAKEQREMDFTALHQQLVAEAGTRGTSWDRLWDPAARDEYYLRVEDDGSVSRHPKDTAICDQCDSIVAPEDKLCAQCNAPRSAKNKKLYVGFRV